MKTGCKCPSEAQAMTSHARPVYKNNDLLYNGRDNKILDLLFCLFGFRMFGQELTMYGMVLHFLTGLYNYKTDTKIIYVISSSNPFSVESSKYDKHVLN